METVKINSPTTDRLKICADLLERFAPNRGSLLDVAAGHGMFSIMARDIGYQVTAMDARTERTPADIDGIHWITAEIENFDVSGYDTVLLLGILYHLPIDEQLAVLSKLSGTPLVIIDTHMCGSNPVKIGAYAGSFFKEASTREELKGLPKAAVNNLLSFWPMRESLLKMITDAGFTQIFEVEPYHHPHRTFFAAVNK